MCFYLEIFTTTHVIFGLKFWYIYIYIYTLSLKKALKDFRRSISKSTVLDIKVELYSEKKI